MERLDRQEQETAALRRDVMEMTKLVKRALVRRQEDRELRHLLLD